MGIIEIVIDPLEWMNFIVKFYRYLFWQRISWMQLPENRQITITKLYECSGLYKFHAQLTYFEGDYYVYRVKCPYPYGEHKYYRKLKWSNVMNKIFCM
jgi:hypothetical protein